MTQTQAQTVVSDLVAQNYKVTVDKLATGDWIVTAEGEGVNPQAVATFATGHSVTATISKAKFQ